MRERFAAVVRQMRDDAIHLGSSLLDVRRMFLYDENIRGDLPRYPFILSQTATTSIISTHTSKTVFVIGQPKVKAISLPSTHIVPPESTNLIPQVEDTCH